MKKIILPLVTLLLAVVLSIVIYNLYGWYIGTTHTGTIDGSTKNVALEYTINNSEENITSYTINNLAFFDSDSSSENSYLADMSVDLSLKLTNTTDNEVSYTITYEGTKRVKQENSKYVSSAYCAAVFTSKSMVDKANIDALTTDTATVDYANTKYTADAAGSSSYRAVYTSGSNLAANANTTINLYLFGIQDIDTAVNEDFIYNGDTTYTYSFTLTISAMPQGNTEVNEASGS